jgi:hypothetical protein
MSRSSRRRRGRPYQPLPARRSGTFWARAFAVFIVAALILGAVIIVFGR